ncbi:MAG: ribosome maturation factor RimM [Bifidobacteriaceae bacterium]|jgi:16S rRNA processing protein RimM|nr:ribosome maturation factor RimM [Bifidobacteriaceae bacterium]
MSYRVAKIVGAHGLKGEAKLFLFTNSPQDRFYVGAEFSSSIEGKTFIIKSLRVINGHYSPVFEGYESRSELETLFGTELFSDDSLTDEDNFSYEISDLIGLEVYGTNSGDKVSSGAGTDLFGTDSGDKVSSGAGTDLQGAGSLIGKVSAVINGPGQDLLELKLDGYSEKVLLPFVEQFVPNVDLKQGFIQIDPPAGLF